MIKKIDKGLYRIVILVSLTVILSLCVCWFLNVSKVHPKLVINDINLGSFEVAHTMEQAVRLENQGSGELLIYDVKTCCGMSLAGDFPKRISAGSEDVFVIRIRIPESHIPLEKNFVLHTNDPIEPVKKVFIRGVLDLPVYVSPTSIDIQYIVAGKQVKKAGIIMLPDNGQMDFNIVTSSPNIQVSSPRSIPQNIINGREYSMYAIDILVTEKTPRGTLQEYIFVKTGIAGRPYVVVPVKGMVESGLRVRPEQVFFGMVRGESIVTRSIRLEVIGPDWDSINVRPPDCPGIAAKLQQKGEKKFDLHVSLDPARMPEQLKSHITLEDSSGDTLQIPVLAVRKTL